MGRHQTGIAGKEVELPFEGGAVTAWKGSSLGQRTLSARMALSSLENAALRLDFFTIQFALWSQSFIRGSLVLTEVLVSYMTQGVY